MSYFKKELRKRQPHRKKKRNWLFVPYDQLSDTLGPLEKEDPKSIGIVLVENTWKGNGDPTISRNSL